MVSFTSAPAFKRVRTISVCPSRTANKNGVNPEGARTCKSAPVQKRFDNLHVAFCRRPHQGRLSALAFLGLNRGSMREQRFYDRNFSGPGRRHGWERRKRTLRIKGSYPIHSIFIKIV